MQVEVSQIQKLVISEIDGLDPVTLILDDKGPGRGQITISCYGKSWTAFWGGMGDRTLAEFFCGCDNDYLSGKLSNLSAEQIDFHAISDQLGFCVDRETLELSHKELAAHYGDDWRYSGLPMEPNPEYVYLGRIIDAAKAGIRALRSGSAGTNDE